MNFGLRPRLILIVLAAALPALLLAWISAGRERARERLSIEANAIRLARDIARDEHVLIERGRIILDGLSALPSVRQRNQRCNGALRRALELYPDFLNFGVIDADGRVRCSALPVEGDVDLADRDYFRGALTSGEPTLGSYQIGRITGRPSINLAVPLTGPETETGVLYAAFDVAAVAPVTPTLLPPGAEMVEFDGAGRVLRAWPGSTVQPGGEIADFASLRAHLVRDTGLVELRPPSAPVQVLAFARIPGDVRGPDVYAAILQPRAALYAAATREMRRTLLALVTVTLLALLVTRWLAGRLVLRPVDRLIVATRRLAGGDLGARVGPPYPSGELGGLGRAFDAAAATLAEEHDARDRTHAALRASEASYQAIVDNAPYGICAADLEGRLLRANPAMVRMLGGSDVADVLGLESRRFFVDPDARDALVARLHQYGRIRAVELQLVRLDGSRLLVRASGRVVRDGAGATVGTEWFAEDITEKQELEHRLLHAQKMEAVGRLAGGVAHDFNNMLTVILGYGATLRDRLTDPGVRAELDEIRHAAERAQALTAQLLAFSRKQLMAPRTIDLNELVVASRRMLDRVIGEQIEIVVELASQPVSVRADPSQIEQVIINLAVNARDAMPRGGTLRLCTGVRVLTAPRPQLPPGEYAVLSVEDTGTGMDPETLEHIFEPFFTTKDLGRGTGLGLATVYGIVRQSDGVVTVHSQPGRGSCFELLFPRVPDGGSIPVDDVATVPEPGRGESILLIEDDPAVRALVRRVLVSRGYRVLPAAAGREALDLAAAFSGPIDLLLTDVVLPDLTPQEIRAELACMRPHIPAILMSGYATEVLAHHGGIPPDAAFIAKPFEPSQLLELIRERLTG